MSTKEISLLLLSDTEGNPIIDHEQKANLLWTAFKQRIGVSEFSGMNYNLNDLLTAHDLESLDAEFSQEEIEMVIKTLSNNNAPRTDGCS